MHSLRSLLSHIIDYAGLFPPAKLEMGPAVRSFAEYRDSADSWMLGRFVVPAGRLEELEQAAEGHLPNAGEAPWELSVLGGTTPEGTARALEALHGRHPGGELRATAVEMKASTPQEVRGLLNGLPANVEIFVEIPYQQDPRHLLEELEKDPRGRAKIRTGGVVENAFPSPAELARFLKACGDAGVPFKATAGLHHPLRGSYPLTYEPDSLAGTMFGFLNVFVGAALLRVGRLSDGELLEILQESDIATFTFDEGALGWKGHRLSTAEMMQARDRFARSYGSCSFIEPIQDLQTLSVL